MGDYKGLTNCALLNEPKCGGEGVSQPMSTAVHRSPNKLWISNSIFNLWKSHKNNCLIQMTKDRNESLPVEVAVECF